MKSDHRKSKFISLHNDHRPAFPSGRQEKYRRVKIILFRFYTVSHKIDSVINMPSFSVFFYFILQFSDSDNIQFPFFILSAEFFKSLHHQIQPLCIDKAGSHKELLCMKITFLFTDKTSRIYFNLCFNSQFFFVISLIIFAQYNIPVQLRQVFLQKTFLFPECNSGHINISAVAVVLPANRLSFQIGCKHCQPQTDSSCSNDNIVILCIQIFDPFIPYLCRID